jgi:hypothetical protein
MPTNTKDRMDKINTIHDYLIELIEGKHEFEYKTGVTEFLEKRGALNRIIFANEAFKKNPFVASYRTIKEDFIVAVEALLVQEGVIELVRNGWKRR